MRISKRAETALQSTQGLAQQIQALLDGITPVMQKIQESVPELTKTLQKVKQLEIQVGQLEQIKSQTQLAQPVAQSADDEAKDKIKGGAADNVSEDEVNKKQLDMGQKVEMEHTDDPEIAREIARDHLAEQLAEGVDKEDQDYYTKLKTIHEDKCNDVPSFWRKNLDYGEK